MRKALVFSALFFFATSLFSQSKSSNGSSYKTALGVKVWDGAGISFKTFLNGNNALEVVGYFWNQGTRITGLYEIHGPISVGPRDCNGISDPALT